MAYCGAVQVLATRVCQVRYFIWKVVACVNEILAIGVQRRYRVRPVFTCARWTRWLKLG